MFGCGRRDLVQCLPALQLLLVGGQHRRDTGRHSIERRSIATGGVQQCGGPTGYWWCKSEATQTERKSLCDNLINVLKLLANQQKDGDDPIQRIVTRLHERSRRGIMDVLRRSIEADSTGAVDVGLASCGARPFQRAVTREAPTS